MANKIKQKGMVLNPLVLEWNLIFLRRMQKSPSTFTNQGHNYSIIANVDSSSIKYANNDTPSI